MNDVDAIRGDQCQVLAVLFESEIRMQFVRRNTPVLA